MQPGRIVIRAPARLHFGLFSFGNAGRQYGGVGVMVRQPEVRLEICAAHQFHAHGVYAHRLAQVATNWARANATKVLPACEVRVLAAPPQHVGLGSGTQVALALATALHVWQRDAVPDAQELAELTGRGKRSAVGTYGFLQGGMIVESGKQLGEHLAPLQARLSFPAAWRFVLVRPCGTAGLYGQSERKAFEQLPPVSDQTRQALYREVDQTMLPALQNDDWQQFGESVYRFGHRAGSCFAAVQGGPYNGQRLAALVREIRALGIPGVGQSSWGPTLFCITPDQRHADSLAESLVSRHRGENLDVGVTRADNQGMQITIGE